MIIQVVQEYEPTFHWQIKLNGEPVACAVSFERAGITAGTIESQEMRRLCKVHGNNIERNGHE